MNGKKGLIDSNVIIDISNGKLKLSAIIAEYDYLYASIISYVETLGYNFKNSEEKKHIKEMLDSIDVVNLNDKIAERAIFYRSSGKNISLPDALILATARYLEADLLTSDIGLHNFDPDVPIINPHNLE